MDVKIYLGLAIILMLLWYLNRNTEKQEQEGGGEEREVEVRQERQERKESNKASDLVFLDVQLAGSDVGRIVIRLFQDVTPRTCENFRQLCVTGRYKGTPFHRIIKGFMIQGGDFTNGDGTGGMSIYGEKFEDENFQLRHDQPGLLSMANSGPHTNGSQFFITVAPQPHLDGKHVVFGQVIQGYELVQKMENIPTEGDQPVYPCEIVNCGSI